MINKFVADVAQALEGLPSEATLLLGGFGAVGQANYLIEGLLETGIKDLTVVANNAAMETLALHDC